MATCVQSVQNVKSLSFFTWPVVVLRFVEVAAVVVATPVVSVPPMMAVSMTTPSSLAVVPMVTARATIGVHVRAPVTWKKGAVW